MSSSACSGEDWRSASKKKAKAPGQHLLQFTVGSDAGSTPEDLGPEGRLFKTKLCHFYPNGQCRFGDRCHFAHGVHELGTPSQHRNQEPQPPQHQRQQPLEGSFYKTRMCDYYKGPGGCPKGERCTYAHGARELRANTCRAGSRGVSSGSQGSESPTAAEGTQAEDGQKEIPGAEFIDQKPAMRKRRSRKNGKGPRPLDLNLSERDDLEAPEAFCCPITQEVLRDPVIASDGHTYERAALQEWLAKHQTSPMTNTLLEHTTVVPNKVLRQTIAAYYGKALEM